MPSKWEIINGVKYPVVDDNWATTEEEEMVSLPRGYWLAIETHKERNEAALTIQKYVRIYTKRRVPKYFQKQWENFKTESLENITEAVVSIHPEPEPEPETMYTRLKARRGGLWIL